MHKETLIIFDWDGVLFDTLSMLEESYRRTLAHFGMPPVTDKALLCSFVGPKDTENVKKLGITDPALGEKFVQKLWATEREVNMEQGALYPGIYDVLMAVKENATLALVSNGGSGHILSGIEHCGLEGLFIDITTADMKKPKAETFARLKAAHPGKTIVTAGDRRGDIEAGVSIGAYNIASLYGFGAKEELLAAHAFALNAKELREALESAMKTQ